MKIMEFGLKMNGGKRGIMVDYSKDLERIKATENFLEKFKLLFELIAEQNYEIEVLRHYGNKDSTSQADDRMNETSHLPINERWD